MHQPLQVVPKSAGIAYVLLLFFGNFGVHQFYLGRTRKGLIFFVLTLLSCITLTVGTFRAYKVLEGFMPGLQAKMEANHHDPEIVFANLKKETALLEEISQKLLDEAVIFFVLAALISLSNFSLFVFDIFTLGTQVKTLNRAQIQMTQAPPFQTLGS